MPRLSGLWSLIHRKVAEYTALKPTNRIGEKQAVHSVRAVLETLGVRGKENECGRRTKSICTQRNGRSA